ncbi:MAG: site-2 protease family protein [Myxococcales bacterium]|nr:site-2 protease family protein [Myxococcales bacterium]
MDEVEPRDVAAKDAEGGVEPGARTTAPSGRPSAARASVRTNIVLFAITVVSVFFAGAGYESALPEEPALVPILRALPSGYKFAVPLLVILLVHEFGHYIAARLHSVEASLPYFIPAPMLNPFGTMGAVIAMPDRIRSRSALLDIGAAGPLAGLVVAIPVTMVGLATSKVEVLSGPYDQEGQSLLYALLKLLVLGPIPPGSDVSMNATAFAGWTGLFVTALNLIPVGQLDGGHIAYALFGPVQNRIAAAVHGGLLLVFGYNLWHFVWPAYQAGASLEVPISNSTFYVVWFVLLALMRWRAGVNHPPYDGGTLSPGRKAIAVISLALFVMLFMPTPWASYR